MKKKRMLVWVALCAALLFFQSVGLQAQVHIGDTDVSAKGGSLLDLTSTTAKLGLLPLNVEINNVNRIPAAFTDSASITVPAESLKGLIVYNTNATLAGGNGAGLYVWDGAKWNRVFIACTGAPTVGALTAPTVCIGGTLALTANVVSDNGSPVTQYEWKLGGTTIGTSASLSYAVQTADNGKALTLSVTNICGTTITTGVTLTVPAVFTQGNPTAATICSGATNAFTLAAPTGGSGAITYNWQQSADNSTWANATGTRNAANYTTPALTSNMYYRRQATAATCGGTITSNAALVTVTPVLTTAAPAAVTICYNTATTFTVAAATGGSGTLTYQWQSSANGTSWTDISGATSANYTTPSLTANTYYRRNAIRATCGGTVSSASALVTVTANFTQGNPTAATICSGATNAFTLAAPTGGSGAITYNWQQSADNSTWANATGTRTGANYTTPALTSNMYYRRQATAATCGGTITSNAALVTVTPVLTTANPAAVTICYNTATTFTVAAATGGSGTLTYQWQSSANGTSWTDISGATSANYTTPTLTANTYYRRNAIRATCGGTVSSASALVTVTANFTQGNPTAATICSGATNAFTLAVPTGGSGTITYNWQQSADNATWANATGTRNAANYTTPTLTSNMYYRRQATAATCGGTITSNAALVTVTPVLTTAAPAAVTICYNTATTFTVAAATGGSGTLTYQWQSSANGTSWTNISGATSANYTTPSLTANTYYRRNAIRATCGGTVSSASALVTVTANFTQGNPTATTINNGATAAFSLAAATGGSGTLTYQWEQSANNSTWENASGTSTNAAYTTPALTGNMYYRRKAISTTCGGTITSSAALVTVRACSAKPATPGAMTISTAAVLVNGTFTATVPAVTSGTLIPTSYTWSLPAGLTGSSTTNSITIKGVTVGTYAAGSIKVTAQNDCGTSDVASNTVTKTVLPSGTTTRSCGAIVYRFTGTVSYTNCPQSARPTTTCICSMGLPTYSNNWSATSATRYTTIGSTGCSENDSGGDVGQRECYQKVD